MCGTQEPHNRPVPHTTLSMLPRNPRRLAAATVWTVPVLLTALLFSPCLCGGSALVPQDSSPTAVAIDDDDDNASYIFFMKAPTSPPFQNVTWLQQQPQGFTADSFRTFMAALGAPPTTNPKMRVGLTFQWELLDCFLSPHSCSMNQTVQGVVNFLDAAAAARVPVQVTLDPVQFYYQTGLWNWWNASLPGYDPANVAHVEWTGWSPANATLVAWRDWGAQFRMPTPQPNLASPALLNRTAAALRDVVGAIRAWYEAQPASTRKLLVGVKVGEEVDVGANYYFYENGNDIFRRNPGNASGDPTGGLNWTRGLAGGLQPLGYNLLQTLGLRDSGGPPTREELTLGVRHYFANAVAACVEAWPALAENGLLGTHAGACGDPLLVQWDAAMVAPATPGYSIYLRPSEFASWAQPGLKAALDGYDPGHGLPRGRFVVAESACFGCGTAEEWEGYFRAVFDSPAGAVHYLRYYNIEPFLAAPGARAGLASFVHSWQGRRHSQ